MGQITKLVFITDTERPRSSHFDLKKPASLDQGWRW
jgi:hypothetical protein